MAAEEPRAAVAAVEEVAKVVAVLPMQAPLTAAVAAEEVPMQVAVAGLLLAVAATVPWPWPWPWPWLLQLPQPWSFLALLQPTVAIAARHLCGHLAAWFGVVGLAANLRGVADISLAEGRPDARAAGAIAQRNHHRSTPGRCSRSRRPDHSTRTAHQGVSH